MSSPRRQCEMQLPEELVAKMEQLPGGIRPMLHKIEKEFGLNITSSYMGSKNYVIIGPNPDILDLAIETLQRSLDHVEHVKPLVDKLQEDINNLFEADIQTVGSHVELVKLRQFIQRKLHSDQTVVCILNDKENKFTIFAKTEDNLKKVMDEWETVGKLGNKAQRMASSTFSYSSASQNPNYKTEMKLPGGLVTKLEKQRGGISYILAKIEKEFGLKVDYIRHKHLKIYGPHLDVLELAAQTLIYQYVIKVPPENGVLGQLQGKNAVWKFTGSYAKIVIHLFSAELKKLRRVRTVTIKAFPCNMNPTCLDILCSVRVVEMVKSHVEKIVGEVHNLYEREIQISDDAQEISRVKRLVTMRNDQGEVLCLFDDHSRKLKILGRNEIIVSQMVTEVVKQYRKHPKDVMPDEFWTMYRQLYQTKIADAIVHMLEQAPGGIIPLIQRIEKEYGVKTMYNRKKQMILISPTEDVLELAQETLKSRYIHESNESNTDDAGYDDENTNIVARPDRNELENKQTGENTEDSRALTLPDIDTAVHKLHNLHHGYTPPPTRSRTRSKSPVKSIVKRRSKLPYRSPEGDRKQKRVMFA